MFRLVTLEFRGRIHISLAAQSRSQVSQVHILHLSLHPSSLCYQGTEGGRMGNLTHLSLSIDYRGSLNNYLRHQNFVQLLLAKMKPNLSCVYTFSRSLYEYVE